MTRHTVKPAARLAALAIACAEAHEWLEKCPFDDGQPFLETAGRPLDKWGKEMLEDARSVGNQELIESIEIALDEGDYGAFDDAAIFWRYIANWANGFITGGIWEK